MKNIRPEVVSKGKALAKISFFSGETTAYSNIASLISDKLENSKDESYEILSELLNEITSKRDEASEFEKASNDELDELLRREKSASSQAGKQNDDTHN
ncbi:hypothetical protein [Staphylococcus saprophyticus]|uniref:hypothetical protein n=1 Tax=Staphylococcus saprophyticus TaxID=29385 RepID=UPI000852FD01|nr:hypothetical protein [Staphylococcus saprophyticus]OEK44581.1 hypothetical protein ASS92_10945 [Staphylococcus saprophyticus]